MDNDDLNETQRQALANLKATLTPDTLWQAAPDTLWQAAPDALWNRISDSLWLCILAFESYPFTTTSGLPFSYSIKVNRRGEQGKEIVVSRKEKSITRSSVEKALAVVMSKGEPFPVPMTTPKGLNVCKCSNGSFQPWLTLL